MSSLAEEVIHRIFEMTENGESVFPLLLQLFGDESLTLYEEDGPHTIESFRAAIETELASSPGFSCLEAEGEFQIRSLDPRIDPSRYAWPTIRDGNRGDIYVARLDVDTDEEPEYGLFAHANLPPCTVVGIYAGAVTGVQVSGPGGIYKVYGDLEAASAYVLEVPLTPVNMFAHPTLIQTLSHPEFGWLAPSIHVDAASFRNELAFANHADWGDSNMFLLPVFDGENPYMALITTRAVPKDTQLTFDYSEEYFDQDEDGNAIAESNPAIPRAGPRAIVWRGAESK